MNDQRKRKKDKIIYDLLISRIRSEENALFALHEKLGKEPSNTLKEQIRCREIALGDIQHALDWYVDKLINDRRS